MNLKNHTSSVPVSTTIARIEQMLADAGASGIGKEYANGVPVSLVFKIHVQPDQPPVCVKLPANVEKCQFAFWKDHCKSRSHRSRKTSEDFKDQAARTAWKLQQDWVEVQLSMIRLEQLDTVQAFLAYAFDGKQTFYERVKDGGYKALSAPSNA